MTSRNLVSGLFVAVLIGATILAANWLLAQRSSSSAKPATAAPATVDKPLKEDQVNQITLTPEAIQRLALQTSVVERKPMRRSRVYGAEIIVPAGQAVIVSAPVSGVLRARTEGMVEPGQTVKAGQPMFELLPLLTPEGRATLITTLVETAGQIKAAETQCAAAKIALERAERVFKSEAGSKRSVDEAQAIRDLAEQVCAAAKARHEAIQRILGDVQGGTGAPLVINSPRDGLLRNLSALPGQNVPAGAALFEIVNLDRVWLRVPVYVGDLPDLDTTAEVRVSDLTARPGDVSHGAQPVVAPPSANLTAGTTDLFYEFDNRDLHYSPAQRVAASVAVKGETESLTVPWPAVVYDVYGGAWLYEQTGERTFVRRRVMVRYVTDGAAVLAGGPSPGTKVVTAGAAELFGAETGFTK